MTTTDITQPVTTDLAAKASRHLWGHFARHGENISPPIITRGEGVYVYDEHGNRYLDGLSGLFCCNAGHGRADIADAASAHAASSHPGDQLGPLM